MRTDLYNTFFELDKSHWWFIGRRKILTTLLNKDIPVKAGALLDIGSGPAINIPLIRNYATTVDCLEASPEAIEIALRDFPELSMVQGYFPDTVPDKTYDAISMFDVLEHIADDVLSVSTVFSKLRPGGHFIVTVPAYNFLWSEHDDHVHHKRRYTKRHLASLIEKEGFEIVHMTYFNTFLFLPIAAIRITKRFFGVQTDKTDFNTGNRFTWLNTFLAFVFGAEKNLLKYIDFPFGVSLYCVAKKKKNA